MKNDTLQQAAKYSKKRQQKKRWYRVLTCLAAVVVFCTTYALILPAITMEKTPICGKEEHVHSEACYAYENVVDEPTPTPTVEPTHEATVEPTVEPTPEATSEPTLESSPELTPEPTMEPVPVAEETAVPEETPHAEPTMSPEETPAPTLEPTPMPEPTPEPTVEPTPEPTVEPTPEITPEPTMEPIPEPVLICGMEEHTHDEVACYETAHDEVEIQSTERKITRDITVYQLNSYKETGATVIFYGGSADSHGYDMNFSYWTAIIVEESVSGALYVADCITSSEIDKSAYQAESENGFVLLIWHTNVAVDMLNINVGDFVSVPFDYKQVGAYTEAGYGTITFADGEFKEDKDNSSKLEIVKSADTDELITVNLYDYNNKINDLWRADSKYPGFQQDKGSINVGSSFSQFQSFNFGNNITSDLSAGESGVTRKEGDINKTNSSYGEIDYGAANIPISDAIYPTLIDGYPALADRTSLKYLFTDSEYAIKQNKQNINGLFRKNEVTGSYHFNSRENHAQFNSENDTFTLYKQMISSNFMMYPFGNFLPFNDIVQQSAQTSSIDRAYFLSIADSAQYKANSGMGEEYGTLAKQLDIFINLMDDAYGTNWVAADAVNQYFVEAGLGARFAQSDALLQNLYTIDYDEPTNFFFGMEMQMDFMQPKEGWTGNDGHQPMVFYFTGDDDVWVYIDDVLFLDLSGIHRHVGGEIDFVNGLVKYYVLDVSIGDVSSEPYKTVTFQEILGDSSDLNEKGTFENYSIHSFNFYYMERGAGSGVCRMNFNFPLLKQNAISVAKELTVDEQDKLALLGNPDFKFQILKADDSGAKTEELFIGEGVAFEIYDDKNNKIGSGTTLANGVFTLKAGQRAEFNNISENAGKYYVRELLDPAAFEQYGSITVDGSSTTTNYDVTVGADCFTGVSSSVKDASDGTTVFHFKNQITFNKLGTLEIQKVLNAYSQTRAVPEFEFAVTLDDSLVPIGTEYTVTDAAGAVSTRTVVTEGILVVPAGATAKLANMIAGTKFTVQETGASAAGYAVTYSGSEGVSVDGNKASGTIVVDSGVSVTVTNSENGTSLSVPVKKTILNPDGTEHTFRFKLEQTTDAGGKTLKENGVVQEVDISVTTTAEAAFALNYLEKAVETFPTTFYYRIAEVEEDGANVDYDESIYVMEVTVSKPEGVLAAEITRMWKDGTEMSVLGAPSPMEFTNMLLADLTLRKVLSGVESNGEFEFNVEMKQGEIPINGTFSATKKDAVANETMCDVTFLDGTATIKLKADESITIFNLPQGAVWTITETNAEGFHTIWRIDDTGSTQFGTGAGGTLTGNNFVVCTNAATYVLPNTGGTGTNLYTAGGVMMLLSAASLLLCKYKKRRHAQQIS